MHLLTIGTNWAELGVSWRGRRSHRDDGVCGTFIECVILWFEGSAICRFREPVPIDCSFPFREMYVSLLAPISF